MKSIKELSYPYVEVHWYLFDLAKYNNQYFMNANMTAKDKRDFLLKLHQLPFLLDAGLSLDFDYLANLMKGVKRLIFEMYGAPVGLEKVEGRYRWVLVPGSREEVTEAGLEALQERLATFERNMETAYLQEELTS